MILRTSLPLFDRTIYWLMSRACLELQTDKTRILDDEARSVAVERQVQERLGKAFTSRSQERVALS